MKKKGFLAILITLVMIIIGLIPVAAITAFAADGVPYLDADGKTKTANKVTEITVGGEYGPGWYLLRGTQNMDTIAFNKSGEVHLIIENGADVTVNSGILLYEHITSLTIYAQPTGAGEAEGKLTACCSNNNAGIGSGEKNDCGDIIVNGGTIIAKGNVFGAGIGAGCRRRCGNITINGGHVTAIGGQHSAGIGTGLSGSCGNITIGGGTVIATGAHASAGIGTGVSGRCGSITVTDATVTATGGYGAPGIGGGAGGSCCDININDTLTIKAGADADSAQTVEKYEGQQYVNITYTPGVEPVPPAAHTHRGTPKTAITPAGKTVTYYGCDCGKIFVDAACTIEITDLNAWLAKAGSEKPQTGTTNHRMLGIVLMCAFVLGLSLYAVKKCGKEH